MIASAKMKVTWTARTESTFGRTCLTVTCHVPAPWARLASTNVSDVTASARDLTSRATLGVATTVSAAIRLGTLGPRAAARATASSSAGIAISPSHTRMRT
jgi:hypothetical protein